MGNRESGIGRRAARLVLLGAAALLAGCGFHLRQQAQLPAALQHVHVAIVDPYGPLARDLPAALKRSGAVVEESATPGAAELRVSVASFAVDTLSVGATARVREYTIRYHVEFDAVDAQAKPVLDKQTIELSRDYSFDETQALGIAAQEDEFKKDLERDMVAAILRRLEAAGRSTGR
jgi:LPS-assembly lipoprotein